MAAHDIIVIGGSAGSTEALKAIVRALPADLQASVFIVTHLPSRGDGYLVHVLGKISALPVLLAADLAPVQRGRIYVGPPDRHLLLVEGQMRLGLGPRENMVRPSIDPLFRSAAVEYGPRVIGVVLSGLLNDGASGLFAVKQCGGLAVVQDPDDAEAPDMPLAAMEAVEVDHTAAAESLGQILCALVATEAPLPRPTPMDLRLEVEIAAGRRLGSARLSQIADPAPFSCPQCQGVLSQVREGPLLRFRCQVGHAVTGEILYKDEDVAVEEALRMAMRVMEERSELVIRMGKDARRLGRSAVAELYEERAQEYGAYADTLRRAVLSLMEPGDEAQSKQD